MKKIKMLLSALLALCLVFCLPDVLALDDSATPENSPEVVGWLPEQVGSWVGFHENLWEQYTFYKNGKYDLTVFEDPSLDCRGSFETIGKADSVTIDGDLMLLTVRGITSTFRRLLSPYIRLRMEESAYIPSITITLGRKGVQPVRHSCLSRA